MSEFSPVLGGNEGYGAGDDVKQPAMGLSTDKNTNKMKVHFGNRQ